MRWLNRYRALFGAKVVPALLICAASYLLACIGCASCQRRLIYFPPKMTSEQADETGRSLHLERWTNSAGKPIGWKRLGSVGPSTGQVLILHGNGGAAVQCAHYADKIQEAAPLDVYVVEYPGYADRSGAPSERTLEESAEEALNSLATNKPTYLVGESLGTGVAAYLAGHFPDRVAGVALLAPYNGLVDVAQAHMVVIPVALILCDRFPASEYLRSYHGPIAMAVGGQDRVVPEKFGRRLYDDYAGPKKLWEFPQGDHGTIMMQPPAFWGQVVEFWIMAR